MLAVVAMSMQITEVATVMIQALAPKYRYTCEAIKTDMIGVQAGEN